MNAVLLRMTMVAIYVAAFRALPTIKHGIAVLRTNPLLFLQLYETVERKRVLYDSNLRSFFVILLGIIALLPIFKTLTAEIATDTIWLNFLVCQIIYCIGSVRSAIVQCPRPAPSYSRSQVIPLDESLLISKKITASNEASSIAAVIGFILVFSRIRNNFDIVYLQTIGFLLYFFLPKFLEHKRVCLSTTRIMLLAGCVAAVSFWTDRAVCVVFAGVAAATYAGMRAMSAMLE